jgi:type I restriction enzyme S subunit
MFLSSETGRQTILEKARTTAGQFNVNLATLRSIPIPLPPLVEQAEIMKIIELIFSVTDKTEEIINKQIAISERLRQSILKDAFAGQLVPQDPNDESAAKLLESIKADRYNNGKFKMNNQVELSGYVK